MKVIILAAGVGQRLGDKANGKPKCLLQVGGKSLLQRHINNLEIYPVSEVQIITGFQQENVLVEIESIGSGLSIKTKFNPDFRDGSVVSLWNAKDALLSGDDIVLMDADVLYDQRIMETLMKTNKKNCFLLDRDFEDGDEPVKLCVHNGLINEFRKQIEQGVDFDFQGESVGFFRFSPEIASKLFNQTQSYIDQKRQNEPYEEAIRDLLLAEPDDFSFEDITRIPWIEIDFPEDMIRAESQILPKIQS